MAEINLSGPEGNAFFLIGRAKTWGKQLGYDSSRIGRIMDDMKSGDYNNLVRVFKQNFEGVVTLFADSEIDGLDDDLYEVIW